MIRRGGDDPRRQAMREALARLQQAVAQEQGDELSWIETDWGFELYVGGKKDSDIGLDELARIEAWLSEL